MQKRMLSTQLEAVLSHIRLSSEDASGHMLSDYIQAGTDFDMLDDNEQHLYVAEQAVMDLLMQLRTEPDEVIEIPDPFITYVTEDEDFSSIESADTFLTAKPQDETRNKTFNILKREAGYYIKYTLVAQRQFATEEKKS